MAHSHQAPSYRADRGRCGACSPADLEICSSGPAVAILGAHKTSTRQCDLHCPRTVKGRSFQRVSFQKINKSGSTVSIPSEIHLPGFSLSSTIERFLPRLLLGGVKLIRVIDTEKPIPPSPSHLLPGPSPIAHSVTFPPIPPSMDPEVQERLKKLGASARVGKSRIDLASGRSSCRIDKLTAA
jgi:hypothetical protein